MFSVKSENILLNYFVVLFTVGLLALYYLFFEETPFPYPFVILFFVFTAIGILLYFDRYYFFKISFLILLVLTILYLVISTDFSLLMLLILFISLSQICVLLSYLVLFVFLLLYLDALEVYLIFAIFVFSLIFTFLFKLQKLQKDIYSKLFLSEGRYSVLKHNIANLCSILFFKNKDKSLTPFLEEMRLNLNSELFFSQNSKTSIAGILRIVIYLLNYDFNLKAKSNYFVFGESILWVCFFYHLLDNFAKKGSTIIIGENSVSIFLKCKGDEELKKFLKNQFVYSKVEIKGNVLKIDYGK